MKTKQKQNIINIMKSDEEAGLYDEFIAKDGYQDKESNDIWKIGVDYGIKWKTGHIENFCNKRIKELAIAKTKFIEHKLNDWIEIPDYKISVLKEVLSNCLGVSDNKLDVKTQEKVLELMRLSYEAGFKQADLVEAGLEGKETDETVRWIYAKNKL